jgi:alpha-ribazole phosphatase
MSVNTRLLLIRHAQPREEAHGRCYGTLDIGLSARGLRHARHLARTLDRIDLAAIYSSPRQRALETAAALGQFHELAPIVDDRLREIDFGDFEGRTYEEIALSHPYLYRQWMETPTLVEFPRGESYTKLRMRALAALQSIRAGHPGEAVVIVAHGGVLRAMLAHCLAIPDNAIFRIDQSYGAISIIDWIDDVAIVRLINGQANAVAHGRLGFLPAFAQSATATPRPPRS